MKRFITSIVTLGLVKSFNSYAERGDHQGHDKQMHKSHSEQTESAEETQVQKTCPVMGGEINKETYSDYDGKRVYFCCPGCIGEF